MCISPLYLTFKKTTITTNRHRNRQGRKHREILWKQKTEDTLGKQESRIAGNTVGAGNTAGTQDKGRTAVGGVRNTVG
jgi:hypothetical protein